MAPGSRADYYCGQSDVLPAPLACEGLLHDAGESLMSVKKDSKDWLVRVTVADEKTRCPTCGDKPHDVMTLAPPVLGKPWEMGCSNQHTFQVNFGWEEMCEIFNGDV
jgi:hypothetical protein